MGAVICTSEKSAAPLNERPNSKHSGKSLRRKITKDSIYDSSDFIECSSLIHSSEKEKTKKKTISDGQNDNTTQLGMEFTTASSDVSKSDSPSRPKVEFSKYSSSQSFFKHVWNRKHKTYSSVSTQCIRRISCDNQLCFIKKEHSPREVETAPSTALKESVGQQTESEILDKETCPPPSTCLEHLTSFLSFDGKCGLCDFVHSGEHYRWDSLDDDATAFKEVSKSIGKWLHSTPKFVERIILQKAESCQKVRIILRRDKNGVQDILVTDGSSSFQIQVANPPENTGDNDDGATAATNDGDVIANQESGASTNGSGSVVIRRMNPRGGQLLRSKAQESDSLDQTESRLPPVDTMEACNKAAERLRELANHLQHGEVPIAVLQKALQYAACVLDTVCVDDSRVKSRENNVVSSTPLQATDRPAHHRRQFTRLISKSSRRTLDEDDELSEFHPNAVPTEVREWLASTFTKKIATQRRRSEDKPRFRSVANAIRAGIMVDRLYRRMSNSTLFYIPTHISLYLKGLDEYSFDVFSLNEKANGQGLRYLAYDLLNRYGLTHKFKIASATMENFMSQVLQGYVRHKNPYHNDLHAADVTQTVHYMLCQQGLANWLTDLEIFAALIAAIIHDFEHTGTTNNFHVMSKSDTALLYNDRAVLENHHVSTAFRLMREEESNILFHLSKEEYREFRTLVIDMVLATDMSSHFQQIKSVKSLIGHSEFNIEKSKALSLVLHCCDISHPSKNWDLHHKWTLLLMEEFFLQGDKEKSLGLPFSPLCDRNTTLIAESQIGFIDFIVAPSLEVCGDMLEKIEQKLQTNRSPAISESVCEESSSDGNSKASALRRKSQSLSGALVSAMRRDSSESLANTGDASSGTSSAPPSPKTAPPFKSKVKRPWLHHLEENKTKWRERTHKDAELRAQLSVVHDDTNGDSPRRVVV